MVYSKVNFVNHVTPLDAINMNTLDNGIYNNESRVVQAEGNLNKHISPTNVTHYYRNISSDIGANASYFAAPKILPEDLLTIRHQIGKIIGDNWHNESWYNENLSSHASILSNISSEIDGMIFSLGFFSKDITDGDYLLGGGSVDLLHLFETQVKLESAKCNLQFNESNGWFDISFNNSGGEFVNFSSSYSNPQGYRESIDLLNTNIPKDTDGLEIEINNESNLKSLSLVLNYKEML
ncbi:MAG: hypothetical protein KAX49_03830 [Halanaerobiales bacterium]|nr:hypothetical protein [Halanaerobiales bacterium]